MYEQIHLADVHRAVQCVFEFHITLILDKPLEPTGLVFLPPHILHLLVVFPAPNAKLSTAQSETSTRNTQSAQPGFEIYKVIGLTTVQPRSTLDKKASERSPGL